VRFVAILVAIILIVAAILAFTMYSEEQRDQAEAAAAEGAAAREAAAREATGRGAAAPGPSAELATEPTKPKSVPGPPPKPSAAGLPERYEKGGLELYSTYASISVQMVAAAEPKVEYRELGRTDWLAGHRMTPLGKGRWASSLLLLTPGSGYEVKVTVPPSAGGAERVLEARVKTWDDAPAPPAPAPAGKTINAAPGGLAAAVAKAGAGDTVLLAEGDYYESVEVKVSGSPGRPVWIKGAGPKARILGCRKDLANPDGTDRWKPVEGAEGLYAIKLDHGVGFVAAKGRRIYHYARLEELKSGVHNWRGKDYRLGSGWWQSREGTLYVKLEPAADPDSVPMQVGERNLAFDISGRSNLVIDGLEMAYFGTGKYGRAIDIRDSQNIVIQNCRIHHARTGVAPRGGRTERVTVQDCRFLDSSIDEWPWPTVKAHDIEGSAVSLRGGRGLVVRRNDISHFFNGVAASTWGDLDNEKLNREIDVYLNRFWQVGDDPLEPEGTCINNRYFLNTAGRGCLQGISLAPITRGPVYIFHNLFYGYKGGGFKVSNRSKGDVFNYNNTCYTDSPKKNGMGSSGPWDNMHYRNNIIRATRYTVEDYTPKPKSTWDHNCHYTTADGILLKWENKRYKTLGEFAAAKGLEKNGVNAPPLFRDPKKGDFHLKPGSPCIDKGVAIPGLYYPVKGPAPDIGCFESGSDFGPPALPAK